MLLQKYLQIIIKRFIITSLIIFGNSISGGVGAVLSPIFVKDGLSEEEGKEKIINYIMIQAAMISGVMILNLIFFRGSPQSK